MILPAAQRWLRVQANMKDGYLDLLCDYSSHFISALLLDYDVLFANPCAKEYSGQVMSKYFNVNSNKVNEDLRKRVCVNFQYVDGYHLDYRSCTLNCIHTGKRRCNIGIPGIT